MPNFSWFRTHVGLPVIQNLIAGVIGVTLGAVIGPTWIEGVQWAGGCTPSVKEAVVAGKAALVLGDIDGATNIAEDANDEAPNCACTNELMAEVASARMLEATKIADQMKREVSRKDCFRFAVAARRWGARDFQNKGLIAACRAPFGQLPTRAHR